MTDVETLMRYIRIFSDLSNQIRFASQKRCTGGDRIDQALQAGYGD